ncbi:MAG TPA: ferrochelatase [Rhodanobacteraceae bacterium]
MPRYIGFDLAADQPDATRVAVLLVNLGTPEAPNADAVRDYLAEFLSDPRVVGLPRWAWWPVLHGYILRTRPKHSADAYARIWRNDGSPLLVFSQRLTAAVSRAIAVRTSARVEVALAMTYGAPSVRDVLTKLMAKGVRRVLALPLFPQYSATSSGAALDAVLRSLQELRWMPALRTVSDYHDDHGYIAALAASVQRYWAEHGRGEKLLLSFHGIPESYAAAGDPYPEQCRETAARVAAALGLADDDLTVAFQSRLGRKPWLRPYTDTAIEQLARQDVTRLDVLCPGFAVDCLETLEEVALRYRATFLTSGGSEFHYIPALNDSPDHATVLADMAVRELAGWI